MKKKVISALLCITMISSMLIGCGGSGDAAQTPAKTEDAEAPAGEEAPAPAETEAEAPAQAEGSAEGGSVYYLNFKPEVDEQWQQIAAAYTEATGVPVKVVTAARQR